MDIFIRIRSFFEKKAIDDAAKGAEELSKKTTEAGDAATKAQGNSGKAFSAINATAQIAEGGVSGVGNAIRSLAGQFPALNASLAPVGLALAAFAIWKKNIEAVGEAKDKIAKGKLETVLGNEEASIRSLSTAYSNLHKELVQAEEDRKRMADAAASLDDAKTAADLSAIDLSSAEAEAKLNPEDQIAKRKLDLDTARRRQAVMDAAAIRKSDRDLANIQGEGASVQAQKLAAQETISALQSKFTELSEYREFIKKQIDRASAPNKLFMQSPVYAAYAATPEADGKRREQATAKFQPELDRTAKAMEEVASKMSEAVDTASRAEREQYSLSQKVDVNRISRTTTENTAKTNMFRNTAEENQIRSDAEKTLADARRREKEIADEQKKLRDKSLSEWSDVVGSKRGTSSDPSKASRQNENWLKSMAGVGRSADFDVGEMANALRSGAREGRGGSDYAKELKEYQEARADEAKFKAKVIEELKKTRADTARALEALKNLPHQSN